MPCSHAGLHEWAPVRGQRYRATDGCQCSEWWRASVKLCTFPPLSTTAPLTAPSMATMHTVLPNVGLSLASSVPRTFSNVSRTREIADKVARIFLRLQQRPSLKPGVLGDELSHPRAGPYSLLQIRSRPLHDNSDSRTHMLSRSPCTRIEGRQKLGLRANGKKI